MDAELATESPRGKHGYDGCGGARPRGLGGEPPSASLLTDVAEGTPLRTGKGSGGGFLSSGLDLLGPGLLVCLADTDGGCLIVAAQSGARWGYSLLLLQVVLIPVLYAAQELTVRLGVYTQQGLTALIKERMGVGWAWFVCALLVIECAFTMASEIESISAVAELWELTGAHGALLAFGIIVVVVFSCSYRQVETIGIAFGCCEFVLILTMVLYHPDPFTVFRGTFVFHNDIEYVKLIAANIGSVVMPWMIYFQQSAIVARRLRTERALREERCHTLFGSVMTQLVMIGALVTLAAATAGAAKNLESVEQVVNAMAPAIGKVPAKVLVSMGFFGGSLCAAFVVSLAAVWAICEAAGLDGHCSLDSSPRQAPHFYGCFLSLTVVGLIAILGGTVNIVKLSVVVEMVGALLLPVTVGFLFLLASSDALPSHARLRGAYKYTLAAVFSVVCAVSLLTSAFGLWTG